MFGRAGAALSVMATSLMLDLLAQSSTRVFCGLANFGVLLNALTRHSPALGGPQDTGWRRFEKRTVERLCLSSLFVMPIHLDSLLRLHQPWTERHSSTVFFSYPFGSLVVAATAFLMLHHCNGFC